mgnify:FL=1
MEDAKDDVKKKGKAKVTKKSHVKKEEKYTADGGLTSVIGHELENVEISNDANDVNDPQTSPDDIQELLSTDKENLNASPTARRDSRTPSHSAHEHVAAKDVPDARLSISTNQKHRRLTGLFRREEMRASKDGGRLDRTTSKNINTEELADLAMSVDSYESAVQLLIKGGIDRFRILASFEWKALQIACCFMFKCGQVMTLRRISEFLIFLLPEARSRSEEDVQQGERLTQMHGKMQQTAVVLVESLSEADQEVLWCSRDGLNILVQLQLGDAKLFFARPTLQHIMLQLWRGVRPDSWQRSTTKRLQVSLRLLCYSIPNLLLLPCWAFLPFIEDRLNEVSIRLADSGRQAEAKHWEAKRKARMEASPGSNGWPCLVGNRQCWNEIAFEHAVKEECCRKVFQIQSSMPLLIPCNKKYLAILTNLLFVAYLIVEDPDGANVVSVLILSAGAWLGEVRQLFAFAGSSGAGASHSLSFWFMDRVNVMELTAFTCIAWTSVLCLIEPEWTELAQQFKALGVLFLGISQSMAMLRMSSVFGPLISMTMNMILDLLHWMMLLFPIVACLVAALMTLFKSRTGVEQKNCLPFGFDYVQGVLRFFEIQIGEEVPLQCLREDSPHPWFGQVIMNLGLWMIMILMLNMLIAMMAKTFDRIYEAAMVDFQYNLIGDLLQMISEPAPPPVLRTLSVPWMILTTVTSWVCCYGSEPQEEGLLKVGTTEKSVDHHGVLAPDHDGTQSPSCHSFTDGEIGENNQMQMEKEDFFRLSADVEHFLAEHASDTHVQDELWRKQIARQLFLVDSKINALQAALLSDSDRPSLKLG